MHNLDAPPAGRWQVLAAEQLAQMHYGSAVSSARLSARLLQVYHWRKRDATNRNVKCRLTWLGARAQRLHRRPAIPGVARSAAHRRGDLAGDRGRGGFHWITRQVCVARRGGRLAVAEHLANDRQSHAARRRDRSERVTQIV